MFELLYTSDVIDAKLPTSNALYKAMLFMKSWVCAYMIAPSPLDGQTHIYKLFHDGTRISVDGETTRWMDGLGTVGQAMSRDGGQLCSYYDPSWGQPLQFLPIDPWIGMAQPQPLVTCTHISNFTLAYARFLDMVERVVILSHDRDIQCLDVDTLEVLWTLSIPYIWPRDYSLHYVSPGNVMLGERLSGWVRFINYDRSHAKIKSSGKVDAGCWNLTYDSVNGVILVYGNDGRLRTYYPKGLPDHFVGPTISPLPVRRCGAYSVDVQLSGAAGEPCEGWVIDWLLKNGRGMLQKRQTVTDAEGRASNVYLAPVSAFDLGDETISVMVLV